MDHFGVSDYRKCVGILLSKDGLIFAGKRLDNNSNAWQMPQGGIEKLESPKCAAIRELYEETGIIQAKVKFIRESKTWLRYDLPKDLVPKLWGGKYKGQEQKWFGLKFTGKDLDININIGTPEFSEWRWMRKEELLKTIVPFKKEVYKVVFDQFSKDLNLS